MSAQTPTPKTPKRHAPAAVKAETIAPPPPSPPTSRHVSPRALRIALAVSVALNLAVLGVVVGAVMRDGGMGGRGQMVRDLGFGPFGEALAQNDRHALRDWLRERAPELRAANDQRRADMIAVQAALRAQPFAPDGLRDALEAMRGRMEGQLALGHEALTTVILAMPDAERLAFADRLERGLRRDGDDEAPKDKD